MMTYIQQFPGLIHFVYIDRRTNQVTAPSFNIMSGEINGMDATRLLKDKVRMKLIDGILFHLDICSDFYIMPSGNIPGSQ